jgi:hypothetical protein
MFAYYSNIAATKAVRGLVAPIPPELMCSGACSHAQMAEQHAAKAAASTPNATKREKLSSVLDYVELRLRQPRLQRMKRERHFGNIRVTERLGRIACGWLNYYVLSLLRIIATTQANQ